MTRTEFVSEWINKKGEKIKVYQVDSSAKEYELIGPGKSSSHFFGNYTQLIKKLTAEGFESKTRHESETIDNFMDKTLSEAGLKPGQKKKIPNTINVTLSPAAKAALTGDPKTAAERQKIEAELKKHAAEYARLNALLNKARLKKDQLKKKQREVGKTITPNEAKYFSLIEKQCSQFLSDAKRVEKFLYRGMSDGVPVLYGKPHVDREPMDTNAAVQRKLDDILKMAGFKALRSNSIFTTSDWTQAEEYGSIYIIFPKNGYSFTWSKKHSDWIPSMKNLSSAGGAVNDNIAWDDFGSDVLNSIEEAFGEPNNTFNPYDEDDEAKAFIKKFKSHPNFKSVKKRVSNFYQHFSNYDIEEIPTQKEIVDLGNLLSEILKLEKDLNFKFPDIKSRERKLIDNVIQMGKHIASGKSSVSKEGAKAFVQKNQFENTDMVAALKSGNEVYINGEYIALDMEKFKVSANKYFFDNDIDEDDY